MRNFFHSLLILLMGVNAVAFAQQEEASTVQTWDGSDKAIEIRRGKKQTFAYTATAQGMLYIYVDDHDANDKVPLSIWGGWYHDGAYDADAPLQDAGAYDNGVGVYGWIKVFEGDSIRFTITASAEAEGQISEFTLKSRFFVGNAGSSWENPIVLTQNVKVALPPFENSLEAIDESHATWCSFTAPSDGVASIYTDESLIYYIKAESFGYTEELPKHVSMDETTNDHEFIVEEGKEYLIFVPNNRPAEVTFKMTQSRLGLSAKFPVEITAFPATLNLVKGNNYYAFSHELIGSTNILEVAAAAGWNGTITYMEDPSGNSTELAADKVAGEAVTFAKNIDPRYLYGDKVIVNFNMTNAASLGSAVTLSLREPAAGESFETAITANIGDNVANGAAGDYWFKHTADMDAEYSFSVTGSIKHVNYYVGVEQKVGDNIYRVREGQTIYVCVTTTEANGTFTVSGKEIVTGDYFDKPVNFELGQDVTLVSRGRICYYAFIAEKTGIAHFNITDWSLHFYNENGVQLSSTLTVEDGDEVKNTYKLPIVEGQKYFIEFQFIAETEGEVVTFTTSYETAVEGDICSTAIEIGALDEMIALDYAFDVTKWFKITADKSGFYTVYAKLGQAANMKTKLGDCDAKEENAPSDNSKKNAYMGGYKAAKVYVEKGQTLYIYTKTGSSNNEEEFGKEFYVMVTFAEARPGEDIAVAIAAEPATEYTIMTNTEGYEQWYTYTIPASKDLTVILSATKKFVSSSLSFYKEDKTTTMSAYKGDFTQTNITNEAEEIIGKTYTFAAADTDRTIYIKVSTVNAMYAPVVWQIEGDGTNDIIAPEVTDEAPVIYDLMGRRVENPTKGIYIINGVKRVIK